MKQENEDLNEQIDFLDKNFEILNNEFSKLNSTHEETIKSLDNLYIKLNSFEQIACQANNYSGNSMHNIFQQNFKFIRSEVSSILDNLNNKKNSTTSNLLNTNNMNKSPRYRSMSRMS